MYEKILADTLDNYKKMPIVIPQKGIFVGFAREFFCENNEAFREDNYHFPMGTAFLRYGVKGIADKARKNACKNIQHRCIIINIIYRVRQKAVQ